MKSAIVLLSGGLDSATTLAVAREQGFECHVLAFNYGQRAQAELNAAQNIAEDFAAKSFRVFSLDIGQFGGSALTDSTINIPSEDPGDDIPITYVPARNTIFLSVALGFAEIVGARHIFIGANAVDYSNYPDCRPEYLAAFANMAKLATKAGVNGDNFVIDAPLLNLSKADIIRRGSELGVDFSKTVSCYQPADNGFACGVCQSCQLRRDGFAAAAISDPTYYQNQ